MGTSPRAVNSWTAGLAVSKKALRCWQALRNAMCAAAGDAAGLGGASPSMPAPAGAIGRPIAMAIIKHWSTQLHIVLCGKAQILLRARSLGMVAMTVQSSDAVPASDRQLCLRAIPSIRPLRVGSRPARVVLLVNGTSSTSSSRALL